MALGRNARRKIAKARQQDKLARMAKAEIGRKQQEVKEIVSRNLSSPPERNYYPPVSSIGNLESMSHRGYVCRASGQMSKQSCQGLSAKGVWKERRI